MQHMVITLRDICNHNSLFADITERADNCCMDKFTFGQRLKVKRDAAGISQLELQKKCGWGEGNNRISNYERGERAPKFEDIATLAKAIGISAKDLMFGEDISPAEMRILRVVRQAEDEGWSDEQIERHLRGLIDLRAPNPPLQSE